tara:strand:+ start:531 stop:773 length:243 start_codon:yes stop_codon:yes gene_type:complete
MAALKDMSKPQLIKFFGDLAISEKFDKMTKQEILSLVKDGKKGYGLSITKDVSNWNKGGLNTTKKYANPVKVVNNLKGKK